MKRLRAEDLSLHHYLKTYALQDFIETESNIPLEYNYDVSVTGSHVYDAVTNMNPNPTSRGRGWVYLNSPFPVCSGTDFVVQEQSSMITVYESDGTVISGSNYMVDYVDGRIIFANKDIIPAAVDYNWYYVALVNEWDVVENSGVPVVAVDIASTAKEGFQLGGGRFVSRRVDLYVFASHQAERDDITETLYDSLYLKSCANQSFPKGTVINWDGTFNTDYEYELFGNSSSLKFDGVRNRVTWPDSRLMIPSRDNTMLSDLNRYRSTISFDLFHYEEAE